MCRRAATIHGLGICAIKREVVQFDRDRGNLPLAFHPLSRVRRTRVAQLPHLLEEAEKLLPSAKPPMPPREKKAHHISSGVSMQPRIPHRTGTIRLMEARDASEHEGGAEPYNTHSFCVIFIYGIHYSFPLILVFNLSELNTYTLSL